MNAAIRSVVRYGLHHNLEVMGIFRGYAGLIDEEVKSLDRRSVVGIINRGGTILESARCNEFLTEEGQRQAVEVIKRHKIGALVVIGGDGTFRGAIQLWEKWHIPCVGVPATIDNDLNGFDISIGADTAINTALEAIDKIRDTATSMNRIFVVEVMGRDSGYIAIQVALAVGAEEVLVPELRYDLQDMCGDIAEGTQKGKFSWIIIVAEGAANAGDIAEKIKEIARKNDIPIIENPPLAQLLYKRVDIGMEIPFDLYQAIAEILAHVYQLKSGLYSRAYGKG